MLVARLVVARGAAHQPGRELVAVERARHLPGHDLFDPVEQRPAVAVRHLHQRVAGGPVERQGAAKLLLGALGKAFEIGRIETLQHQHLGAAQERGIELEGRVLGGRAHQQDGAVLHMRQEPVLLSLVEAVDLVDEQQRALAVGAAVLGRLEDLPELRHAGEDRADLDEMRLCLARQQPGDGGLAHAGRTPEDERAERSRRQHGAERAIGAEQLVLADDLRERLRPQPVSERTRCVGRFGRVTGERIEEIGHGLYLIPPPRLRQRPPFFGPQIPRPSRR